MKDTLLLFSVVRYQPDLQRQEIANVGTVLFGPEGPQVFMASNLTKLLALDPNLSLHQVHADAQALSQTLAAYWHADADPAAIIAAMGQARQGLTLTAPGQIQQGQRTLSEVATELEQLLVRPPSRQRQAAAVRTNRLHSELRQLFRQSGILGRDANDISRHLVVPNFPIDAEVGLFAEFALRNGRLHVTETVDFRTKTHTEKKREAESKALLLVEARERVGAADLTRYVVVTGVEDERMQPTLGLLQRYAEDLIVRESTQDWARYVDAMHRAARPAGLLS